MLTCCWNYPPSMATAAPQWTETLVAVHDAVAGLDGEGVASTMNGDGVVRSWCRSWARRRRRGLNNERRRLRPFMALELGSTAKETGAGNFKKTLINWKRKRKKFALLQYLPAVGGHVIMLDGAGAVTVAMSGAGTAMLYSAGARLYSAEGGRLYSAGAMFIYCDSTSGK